MEDLLFASGLALLLALIGWSEQFFSWHKETLEVEKDFSETQGICLTMLRPLLRSESTPAEKLLAINKIRNDEQAIKKLDEPMIIKLSSLDRKRSILEKSFELKYKSIVFLTFLFFLAGLINLFIEEKSKTNILCFWIPTEFFSIIVCILFSYTILYFTAKLRKNEIAYREEYFKIKERL